ncbi:DNA polymerase [Microbacterium sp. NPDC077391]|uniref:DNA polymerase n=1 Tax=unclassified Microbacterium TaxID=2609290 RepID=UPI0028AC0734|nr:DNA polymerase [Microbacterium sp.]
MLASMYGAAAGRTARQLGVTTQQAKAIRADLWRPYSKAAAWLKAQTGIGPMTLDSGRPLGVVGSAHARPNLIIQSTAYDTFQAAVLRVHNALPKGVHIWMPLHDELVIETPAKHVDRVVTVLAEHLPAECRGVPIRVTPVVLGTRWRKA